jgi:hypothetical protein
MTQMQEAPVYDGSAVQEEATGTNRRVLALVLVLAVILLGAAGWFLLGGGDDSDADLGLGPVTPRPAAVKPSAAPVVKPTATLPPVSTAKIGRDPFKAQYVVPVAPVGPTSGTGAVPGTTTGGTSGTGTDKPAAATTYPLKLSSVTGSGTDLVAKFLVGTSKKIQFAKAGSVFGQSQEIRLLSLERGPNGAGTAVIQVGDDSPFDMSTSDAAVYVQ